MKVILGLITLLLVVSTATASLNAQPKEDEQQPDRQWQLGGFVDSAYLLNFNHPENRLFRSRGTTFRTDSVWLNMAGVYARKRPSADSRWGAGTFFLVNGYWHLARANSAPSAGGQLAYKVTPRVALKQTTLFGPHQRNTAFEFWRFLTDTIVERKTEKFTLATDYIFSTERVDAPGRPRALMMSWQLPARWTLNDRWSIAFRPEVFWDRDGRWTLARQTVKAFTSTLEYRVPYKWSNAIFRLEHRWDDSRGPDGGFFRGAEVSPCVVGLTPRQNLLIFATIFNSRFPCTEVAI